MLYSVRTCSASTEVRNQRTGTFVLHCWSSSPNRKCPLYGGQYVDPPKYRIPFDHVDKDKRPEKSMSEIPVTLKPCLSHVYSLLHNQPASSSMMLNRYLGIEGPSDDSVTRGNGGTGMPENQRIAEHDDVSITTSEFLGDMDEHSTIQSIYEECGAIIEEGFPEPNDSEDEVADWDWDSPSPQTSRPNTPTPVSTPAVNISAVEQVVAFHPRTGLPIPPFMLHNLSPPIPDRRGSSHATSDRSPEGYIRLDPTRPNPHMYYLCQWLGCFSRVRGASTGLIQYHLRRVHQVNDSVNQPVRCEYHISCEEDRICGAEVLVKDLGSHVCDIHWRSRAVQCPFCGAFQTHRGDVPEHWVKLCSEFASASEEERKAWRQYWRWPAKNWSDSAAGGRRFLSRPEDVAVARVAE